MSTQRQKPIDFAAEGLRLALSVDRNYGIRDEYRPIFSVRRTRPFDRCSALNNPAKRPSVPSPAFPARRGLFLKDQRASAALLPGAAQAVPPDSETCFRPESFLRRLASRRWRGR